MKNILTDVQIIGNKVQGCTEKQKIIIRPKLHFLFLSRKVKNSQLKDQPLREGIIEIN